MDHISQQGQAGAFVRHQVGAIDVIALGDGEQDLVTSLFPSAEPAEIARLAVAAGFQPDNVRIAINVYAVRTAGRTLLIDAGSGASRGPGVGHAGAALAAAGIAPADVDAVLMTHMHGDHAGGLRLASGAAAFPKAELWLSEAEATFWSEPGLAGRMPDRMAPTIANAQACLSLYGDRLRRFRPGDTVAPGVTAVDLAGHTPGQAGFLIEDGGERLFVWADVIHVEAFQFAHPDWPIGFDVDGAAAAARRATIFAETAASGIWVAGMHLAFPGIGQVRRDGAAYRFAPA